jgi:hypothetical protein
MVVVALLRISKLDGAPVEAIEADELMFTPFAAIRTSPDVVIGRLIVNV